MSGLAQRLREKRPLLFGILLIILGSLGSTFAATITLNRGGPVQFAQGVFEIDACQSYISIDLYPKYINPTPTPTPSDPTPTPTPTADTYLGQVVINSLDTNSCANTRIGIKFFQSGFDTPLDLYEGGDGQPINELTLEIDNSKNVLIPIQNEGDDEGISQPIFDIELGTWTVNILNPLATMRSIERLTLESGPRPLPSSSSS